MWPPSNIAAITASAAALLFKAGARFSRPKCGEGQGGPEQSHREAAPFRRADRLGILEDSWPIVTVNIVSMSRC